MVGSEFGFSFGAAALPLRFVEANLPWRSWKKAVLLKSIILRRSSGVVTADNKRSAHSSLRPFVSLVQTVVVNIMVVNNSCSGTDMRLLGSVC